MIFYFNMHKIKIVSQFVNTYLHRTVEFYVTIVVKIQLLFVSENFAFFSGELSELRANSDKDVSREAPSVRY